MPGKMKFGSPVQHTLGRSIPSLPHLHLHLVLQGTGPVSVALPAASPAPRHSATARALLVLKRLSCKNYATETTLHTFDIAQEHSQASLKGLLALGSLVVAATCKSGRNLKRSRPRGREPGCHRCLWDLGN